MKQITISVVLATYNEEKNLPACLESVKNLADEIVIIDGTSQDNTVAIAKKYGAKVVIAENNPMFHINKQKAIDMATKDWVLQLDADERVTAQLAEEIKRVINRYPELRHFGEASTESSDSGSQRKIANQARNDDIAGYWIPRKNWFLGRYLLKGGVYPDYTLRLYKRGKGHLPQQDVHEQAVVEGEVGYLAHPLLHMADPDFGRYISRFKRYTDFIAGQYRQQHLSKNLLVMLQYMIVLPVFWFGKIYVRHKGFLDGWQGFIWAFFSANRFPVAYWKYLNGKDLTP